MTVLRGCWSDFLSSDALASDTRLTSAWIVLHLHHHRTRTTGLVFTRHLNFTWDSKKKSTSGLPCRIGIDAGSDHVSDASADTFTAPARLNYIRKDPEHTI